VFVVAYENKRGSQGPPSSLDIERDREVRQAPKNLQNRCDGRNESAYAGAAESVPFPSFTGDAVIGKETQDRVIDEHAAVDGSSVHLDIAAVYQHLSGLLGVERYFEVASEVVQRSGGDDA
jgi:hypothetical protein